jgi:tetratricopeptide (TPR) repeat protein
MTRDIQGHELTGASEEAARHIDAGIRNFTIGHGDPIGQFEAARQLAPDCAMGHLGKAWVLVLSIDSSLAAGARPLLETVRGLSLNERERGHLAALTHAVEGWRNASVTVLDRHLMSYPHDLLAHFAALVMDAFRGRFPLAAGRSARALPRWSKSQPGYGILTAFYGFGLEEAGEYAKAEAVSRSAAEMEPLNYWPHHAVSHVLEMTGRPEDGLVWMDERETLWSTPEHGSQVHIWWHKALFHTELGQYDAAMALYDGPLMATIRPAAISKTNAPALLWRLEMLGCDAGDRWTGLAEQLKDHADGRFCVFADIHAAMAELRAGEDTAFTKRLAAVKATAADGTERAAIYRDIGIPVLQGFAAFNRGAYAEAVEHLLPARSELWKMGGSRAQRDIVDWTLTEAAARAGLRDVAISLANERLTSRPNSAPNRRFFQQAEALAS